VADILIHSDESPTEPELDEHFMSDKLYRCLKGHVCIQRVIRSVLQSNSMFRMAVVSGKSSRACHTA
jgi:hypothetical protein